MQYPNPLISARLVKRYKRFLADVELVDGSIITVHCPNPGSMTGLKTPGAPVWISDSKNPKRKLRHTLELYTLDNGDLVGVNTNMPNKIGEELIQSRKFQAFGEFETLRREVRYGENSRIDILLQGPKIRDTYVEIKNVHFQREPGLHEFPDSKTERGTKHLRELARMVEQNHRAIMLYIIQRNDGDKFKIADDIDTEYARTFQDATRKGVEAIAIRCKISTTGIIADSEVEICS